MISSVCRPGRIAQAESAVGVRDRATGRADHADRHGQRRLAVGLAHHARDGTQTSCVLSGNVSRSQKHSRKEYWQEKLVTHTHILSDTGTRAGCSLTSADGKRDENQRPAGAATAGLRRVPTPSMRTSTTSPGLNALVVPGVPVKIRSPGSSVTYRLT